MLKGKRSPENKCYEICSYRSGSWKRAIALMLGILWIGSLTSPASASTEITKVIQNMDSTAAQPVADKQKVVAIVIDDFGNGSGGTSEMLHLPVKITAAIMPFLPSTKKDAEEAHKLGHEVIVHMPMEPKKAVKSWMGPGGIFTSMSDAEIRERVEKAIDDVPHAVGMNNHMGSKATGDERVMRIVLEVCKERGLFFLDSRTNYWSVVPKVADELNVPLVMNDIFLDDVHSVQHISNQIRLLQKHLETNESCITIGHVGSPGKMTASVLEQSITMLQPSIRFVKLSALVQGSAGDPFELTNP